MILVFKHSRTNSMFWCVSPPAVDYLQCSADSITSVTQMDSVPPDIIYTIQHLVAKSLEAAWYLQENVIAQRLLFHRVLSFVLFNYQLCLRHFSK